MALSKYHFNNHTLYLLCNIIIQYLQPTTSCHVIILNTLHSGKQFLRFTIHSATSVSFERGQHTRCILGKIRYNPLGAQWIVKSRVLRRMRANIRPFSLRKSCYASSYMTAASFRQYIIDMRNNLVLRLLHHGVTIVRAYRH